MEKRLSRTRPERKGVHSVCMTVPTIVLNSTDKCDTAGLSHSRSTGDLEVCVSDPDVLRGSRYKDDRNSFAGSVGEDMQDVDSRNAIGLYCSPRLPRRSVNSEMNTLTKHPGGIMESLNACNLNCLDPGSRVGSTVSLNSEYTSRSVGLISNDSSSEFSQHLSHGGLIEGSYQKHSVLKRFYSSPEKDDEMLQTMSNVRRNSKSLGNMQDEAESVVYFDFGSDSTDEQHLGPGPGNGEAARGVDVTDSGGAGPKGNNLVTAITGGASLREGRIRKWLTEISDPDENCNS